MIELGHDHDHVAEAGIDAVGVAIVGESADTEENNPQRRRQLKSKSQVKQKTTSSTVSFPKSKQINPTQATLNIPAVGAMKLEAAATASFGSKLE